MSYNEFVKPHLQSTGSNKSWPRHLTSTWIQLQYRTESTTNWLTFPWATSSHWFVKADFTRASVAEEMELSASKTSFSNFVSASYNTMREAFNVYCLFDFCRQFFIMTFFFKEVKKISDLDITKDIKILLFISFAPMTRKRKSQNRPVSVWNYLTNQSYLELNRKTFH